MLYFIGRVQAIYTDTCFVTLFNEETKERFEAEMGLEVIRQVFLKEDDEFSVEIIDNKVVIKKLKPKELSKEHIEEIQKMYKNRWTF